MLKNQSLASFLAEPSELLGSGIRKQDNKNSIGNEDNKYGFGFVSGDGVKGATLYTNSASVVKRRKSTATMSNGSASPLNVLQSDSIQKDSLTKTGRKRKMQSSGRSSDGNLSPSLRPDKALSAALRRMRSSPTASGGSGSNTFTPAGKQSSLLRCYSSDSNPASRQNGITCGASPYDNINLDSSLLHADDNSDGNMDEVIGFGSLSPLHQFDREGDHFYSKSTQPRPFPTLSPSKSFDGLVSANSRYEDTEEDILIADRTVQTLMSMSVLRSDEEETVEPSPQRNTSHGRPPVLKSGFMPADYRTTTPMFSPNASRSSSRHCSPAPTSNNRNPSLAFSSNVKTDRTRVRSSVRPVQTKSAESVDIDHPFSPQGLVAYNLLVSSLGELQESDKLKFSPIRNVGSSSPVVRKISPTPKSRFFGETSSGCVSDAIAADSSAISSPNRQILSPGILRKKSRCNAQGGLSSPLVNGNVSITPVRMSSSSGADSSTVKNNDISENVGSNTDDSTLCHDISSVSTAQSVEGSSLHSNLPDRHPSIKDDIVSKGDNVRSSGAMLKENVPIGSPQKNSVKIVQSPTVSPNRPFRKPSILNGKHCSPNAAPTYNNVRWI